MNKDVETRDKIIFGNYNPDRYKSGGVRRFECDAGKLRELHRQGFIDDNEAQNESPTTKEFLEFLDSINDKNVSVGFECYAVSPDRFDYRITIEGINLLIEETDYETLTSVISNFRNADEFDVNHVDSGYEIRAWWD